MTHSDSVHGTSKIPCTELDAGGGQLHADQEGRRRHHALAVELRGLLRHLDNQVPAPKEVAVENHYEVQHRRRTHPGLCYYLQLAAEEQGRHREDMLPPGAQCLRRCLMSFHSLDLQQDTSLLDSSVQAELLWHNNRFTIAGLSAHQQQKWAERYDTNRILSLLDSDGTELTDEAWDYYFLNMAPAHLQGSPAFHLERDTLMAELACIRRDVPTEVIAATACPEIADGDTVVLTTDDTVDYVDVERQRAASRTTSFVLTRTDAHTAPGTH
jgi:hypothetical protein